METIADCLDIYRKIVEFIDAGRSFVLVMVLSAEGSTPRDAGTKAVIDADGRVYGTIGGGKVEAEAQRRAVQACASGKTGVFDFALDSSVPEGDTPICGGAMRILVDPNIAKQRDCLTVVAEALKQRQAGVLLTKVFLRTQVEVEMQWFAKDAIPQAIEFPGPEAISSCIDKENVRLYRSEADGQGCLFEVLVEPVIPKPRLLIVGGGHIGQALAAQAKLIGFDVTVLDDRPEFTHSDLFPESVATICGDIPRAVADFPIDKSTYVVIVTRGHKHDAEVLRACIGSPAAYIGMIGSKRKVTLIRDQLVGSGTVTAEQFSRVYAPIGLNIGAVTVPEIAASIAAQLIAVRRGGSGGHLRL